MMNEVEVWREVKEFAGKYEVSNFGRVRSLDYRHTGQARVLRPSMSTDGYLLVDIFKDGKKTRKFVHRVVAEAFIENPSNLTQVNHRNEIKEDNRVENLEWISQKDNINYGTGNERRSKAQLNHPKKSKRVLQFDRSGNLLREWLSTSEVERQTGWCQGHISLACRGKLKTTHGFVWRYAD